MHHTPEYLNFERRYELMFRIYNSSCKTRSQIMEMNEDLMKSHFRNYIEYLLTNYLYVSTRMRRAFNGDDTRRTVINEFLKLHSYEFSNHPVEYLRESSEWYRSTN